MARRTLTDDAEQLKHLLIPVAKAIATTIGPRCEVVLHDLRNVARDGNTIVWIENGHVTGRKIGGPTTNLGLEALCSEVANPDRYDYKTILPDGRILRSSSVYFHDSNGSLIFAVCINLDISDFAAAQQAIGTLIGEPVSPCTAASGDEVFGTTVDEVLGGMIRSAEAAIGTTARTLGRAGRVNFIRLLYDGGAFEIKRAVDVVGGHLGVSRATMYAYLDQVRQPDLLVHNGNRRPKTLQNTTGY